MNETIQGYDQSASAIVPLKRKRGRPRKYPRQDVAHEESFYGSRMVNPSHGENSAWNQHRCTVAGGNSNDNFIGQIVYGSVEVTFDAGYLLTVRVGNSDTTLRGAVFKPGRYVPLSAENDVAPEVPMCERSEIPVPFECFGQTAEKTSSHLVHDDHTRTPRCKPMHSTPVEFYKANISNGLASASSQPSGSLKGKEQLYATYPSIEPATMKQEHILFQGQNNHLGMPCSTPNEAVPFKQNVNQGFHVVDSKSVSPSFESLLTEVMRRVEVPLPPIETNSSSAARDRNEDAEGDVSESDDALSIEPLQELQPGVPIPPVHVSRPSENYGSGKMTELLKVLQDNMSERQAAQTDEQVAGSSQS